MNEKLFDKYFHDRCSPDEIREILKWIQEESHSLSDYQVVQQIWKDYLSEEKFNDEKFDRMLDKVHHLINLSHTGATSDEKSGRTLKSFYFIVRILSRAAAILFIPLLAFLIYTYNLPEFRISGNNGEAVDTIEIVAPVGSRTFIKLSDGTGVYLNHGSKLRYPQKFIGKIRKVELTGEAYFSVVHEPDKPFLVETSCLLVTATGTEFNVMAYPDESFVETTLVSGKVNIQKKNPGSILLKVCDMESGHYLKFIRDKNTYRYLSVDPNKYISWKDGVLVFKNDPLAEITSRLGRWYNVEFVFRNESVKDFTYTATFVDETLPQILDLLKLATPISYEMTSRIKLPDGTFSKPKVFIDVKKIKK